MFRLMPSQSTLARVGRWTAVAAALVTLAAVALLLVGFETAVFGAVSFAVLRAATGLAVHAIPDGVAAVLALGGYAALVFLVVSAYHAARASPEGFDVAPGLLIYASLALVGASLAVTYWVIVELALPRWLFAVVLVTLIAFVYPALGVRIASEDDEDDGTPAWLDEDSDDGEAVPSVLAGIETDPGERSAPRNYVRIAWFGAGRVRAVARRVGPVGVAAVVALVFGSAAGVYVAAERGSPTELSLPLAVAAGALLTGYHLLDLVRTDLTDGAVLRELGAASDAVDDGDSADGREGPLRERVVRLAATADAPTPEVHLTRSRTPTAAAVGYRPSESTLVVSTGLVAALDERELDAVLAHELAHVANYDAAVVTALSVPRVAAARAIRRYGINPIVALGAGVLAVTGRFCTAVVSRVREFAADDAAVAITGDPAALASALETLDAEIGRRPADDLRGAASAFAVVPPPWEERPAFDRSRRYVARRLLGTHPSTDARVERLRRAAAEREA